MAKDGIISGGCLCGACAYSTRAAPIDIRACHCRICQKATGAPFYARVRVPLDQLSIKGPIGWYSSSEGLRRGFCPRCGTSLFSERAETNSIGLTMGSLDDPDRFQPTMHIFTASKQIWLKLADDLPCYEDFPPA